MHDYVADKKDSSKIIDSTREEKNKLRQTFQLKTNPTSQKQKLKPRLKQKKSCCVAQNASINLHKTYLLITVIFNELMIKSNVCVKQLLVVAAAALLLCFVLKLIYACAEGVARERATSPVHLTAL